MDEVSRKELYMMFFSIPGKAVGKGRPRFANGHAYTPETTKEYEDLVRAPFLEKHGKKIEGEALFVQISVYTEPPKSISKKKREELLKGYPMKKPDLDNVAKIILDALNGVAWKDDTQVVDLRVNRNWATEVSESVIVYINTASDIREMFAEYGKEKENE